MWWKIYFYINVIALILSAFILVSEFSNAFPLLVLQTIAYSVAVYGLYAYLYKKEVFTKQFWLAVLGVNLVFEALYILYSFYPDISYLSSFDAVGEGNVIIALLGLAFSAPLYFANYQLSQGKYVKEKVTKEEMQKSQHWGIVQTALWGYSTVFSGIALILALMPSSGIQDSSGSIPGLLFFGPILIFWSVVALKRKQYIWNWWKKILVTTSVIWSFLLIFGLILNSFGSVPLPAESSLLDLVPMVTIFVSLIIIGREQFAKQDAVVASSK